MLERTSLESPSNPRRALARKFVRGVAELALTASIGIGLLPSNSAKATRAPKAIVASRSVSSLRALKYELTHAYVAGSVKLTSAHNTGEIPLHTPNREIVAAHIKYEVNKATANSTGNPHYYVGNSFPPREVVIGPGSATRPGVDNWTIGEGNLQMQVNLAPFGGTHETTEKYRMFLLAGSSHGNDGKPIAGTYYAGTVVIGGEHSRINSVKAIHEHNIPSVQLIYPEAPSDPTFLSGPANTDNTVG